MGLTDIQQKILELFRRAISNGESLSMRDLGGELDLAPNTILYHIRKLEKKGLVVRDSNGKVVRVNSADESSAVAFLPLLANARCGPPLNQVVDENLARMVPVPLYLLGRNSKKHLYLIKAVGDSMSPKIEDGDFVVFEGGTSAKPGKTVVARTKEGFTIKTFKENKEQYVLEPQNPKYQPMIFKKNTKDRNLNIDGIAIGVFKPELNLGKGN
jgi:repressor LexA